MNKKSISRETAEKSEGLEMIKNEVPGNKLQTEQQVQDTQDATKVEGAGSSFKKQVSKGKGSVLKQEAISDAITGSGVNSGMGINAAGRSVSGTMGGVLGANNSTSFAEKSRQDSRTGKKLDRTATKLNYTPSEQVILAVDESKPLADASNEDQGYNGTYRNEDARSQKIMGAVPGDLMFQRSVDFIEKDKLYFVEGQQVFQNDDDKTSLNPSTTIDPVTGNKVDTQYHTGNFIHRKLHFGLDTYGKVKYCYAETNDITPSALSAEDANVASAHRLIKANVAELDRIVMDTKAGDEKADVWSPLPRAIDEPTKASYLMSSIEADTGAYCYLAYSKASTNMAFQLNRGPKDGLNIVGPAIEQCVGWRNGETDSVTLAQQYGNSLQDSTHPIFSQANYRLGDPSLMIAAYDSVNKYNNKADLLLQPRGYRMHLQTADNNINPLKVPTEFANVYSGTEVYSTIDREYDPIMPVCMTDKANLVLSHNLNELAAFYKGAGFTHVKTSFSSTALDEDNYDYETIKLVEKGSAYKMGWPHIYVYYSHTSGDGLEFDSETGVIRFDSDSNPGDVEAEIIVSPVELSVEGFDEIVDVDTSYAQDIVYHAPLNCTKGTIGVNRTVITDAVNETIGTDTWYYYGCKPYVYKYSDLRNNYIVEVKHPLIQGIVEYLNDSIGGKIRSLIGQEDFMVPMVFSTHYMTLAQLLICAATPWITRVRMNSMKDVIYYEDNVKSYPYSKLDSIKNVPFKNFVNFDYSTYDEPLGCKVMNPVQAINWVMPEFFWKVGTEKYVLPWYFCENDLNTDGTVNDDANTMCMPSIRSGIRLGMLDTLYSMSEKDIRLSLDRMTKTFLRDEDIDSFNAYKYGRATDGQILANLKSNKLFTIQKILSCPRELGLCVDAPLGVLTCDPADTVSHASALKAFTSDGTASSYRIYTYTNVNTLAHPDILASTNVNINRAANYTQKWFLVCANNTTTNKDITGLVFGMGNDVQEYNPFAVLGSGAQGVSVPTVISYQRSVNTRIQFLPFVISPFDCNFTSDDNYSHDIYDLAYFFGLCGFRASDYRESTYNREKEVINQGLTFVSDPWVNESPILRGASASTGLKLTKGYVLK